MELQRVFIELTPEVDYTAQMYASGYEKKEIADKKCRSLATINNQIMKAFEVFGVKNGRELTILLAERLTGKQIRNAFVALAFISILGFEMYHETQEFFRGSRSINLEYRARRNRRKSDTLDLEPLLT